MRLRLRRARERAAAYPEGPVRRHGADHRADRDETCKANGYAVSVTVVGRNAEVLAQVRGDGTGPHTMENSFRKAYTSRTFRIPSGEMVERLKANPQLGLIHLSNVIANQGALPIKVGEETIGAAGASGAPGGEKDEACVKAGIDKIASMLK
ncbi:MAG TPA: heme-binding protein [Burkholderiales bacterium]|nr:heme-binding protein [Burkholderiales bacterium]